MKEFSCGDVVPGCTTVLKGADEGLLLEQVAIHARKDHGIEAITNEMVALVRSLIHDVPAA